MSKPPKNCARAYGASTNNTYIFKAMSFYMYAFSRKNGYFREVFICKSYFIYTLFRGKSYFIWR